MPREKGDIFLCDETSNSTKIKSLVCYLTSSVAGPPLAGHGRELALSQDLVGQPAHVSGLAAAAAVVWLVPVVRMLWLGRRGRRWAGGSPQKPERHST